MPNIVIPLKLDHIYPHFKQILGELLPKAVLAMGYVSLFSLIARFAKISQL